MKHGTYIVSIVKGTNRLVSTTNSDFSVLKEGSFVKFKNENNFYKVLTKKPIYYIKDFFVKAPKAIEIKSNVGIDLLKGDEIFISYKEWEVLTLFEIKNGGRNYKKGETIYLDGGVLAVNPSHNITNPACFEVTNIDKNGSITQLSSKDKGIYIQTPDETCKTFSHDNGEGAVLDVKYKIIDNRQTLERTIQHVDQDHLSAILHLDYPLPTGLIQGKLSMEKWEIALDTNYPFETKIESECHICNDFTGHLGLPVMSRNSFNQESVYNHSISLIDQKIKELEDRILKLEKNS